MATRVIALVRRPWAILAPIRRLLVEDARIKKPDNLDRGSE